MPYVHVTNYEFKLYGYPSKYPNSKTMAFGKPVGLWYASDNAWIDLEKSKEIPAYKFKYEFPLEGKFVENIDEPDRTKIFRLTAGNIDTFENKFQPYFLARMFMALRDEFNLPVQTEDDDEPDDIGMHESYYMKLIADGSREYGIDIEDITDDEIYDLLVQELHKHIGKTLDVKVEQRYEKVTLTKELLGELPEEEYIHPKLFDAIRLIEYGFFLHEKLRPYWGGIHYDDSLFTDELKEKYPFIEKVEIPSGCLWYPRKVMPEYVPTPVQGGKRTRRKRLRKSTRRRMQ